MGKIRDKSNNLPAHRERPKGGWATNPIKSSEHGKNGRISSMRRMKKMQEEIQRLAKEKK